MSYIENKKIKDGYYNVLTVHRDDVRQACDLPKNYKISDSDMKDIADKLGDALLDSGYWIALEIIGENTLDNN